MDRLVFFSLVFLAQFAPATVETSDSSNESACSQCRVSPEKHWQDCIRCHLCDGATFEASWPDPQPNSFDYLLAAEFTWLDDGPQLASIGLAIAQVLGLAPPTKFELNLINTAPASAPVGFRGAKVTADYRSIDWQIPSHLPAKEQAIADFLEKARLTLVVCEDTNHNTSCADEDRQTKWLARSDAYPLCSLPLRVKLLP